MKPYSFLSGSRAGLLLEANMQIGTNQISSILWIQIGHIVIRTAV